MIRPHALSALLVAPLLTACAIGHPVSYRREVRPLLEDHCTACHIAPAGEGYRQTGLDLTSHEGVMRGTLYGAVVLSADSRHSILNMLVERRADASLRMLHDAEQPLPPAAVETVRRWVNPGAKDN